MSMAGRPTNHPLSAPNASVRLLKGPKTGPSTGPILAHQKPSPSGSTWLARQPKGPTGNREAGRWEISGRFGD
jgi:hypothetical protein